MVTRSDSDKINELGSNPSKGIFVLVLFFLRRYCVKFLLASMECRRNKKVI